MGRGTIHILIHSLTCFRPEAEEEMKSPARPNDHQ